MKQPFPTWWLVFFFACLSSLSAAPAYGQSADPNATLPSQAAASQPVRAASEIAYPPFCIVYDDGQITGFSNELLRAALSKMGREVTFKSGPWSDVRQWLATGEVQALPLVGRTPEREPLFDFTFPYMSIHGAIVVRKGTRDIHNLDDLNGRHVAVMRADNAEEFLKRQKRGLIIHETPTFEDALQQLSDGKHDAVVIQRLVGLRLISEMGLTNLKIIDKPIQGFRQDFCFAVKEGDRDTLALLNEGLALVMADGTFRHLHSKWFAALELPTHRRIVFGGDENYPPFEYLDEDGNPAGYNIDLIRALAEELELKIEIRLGPWSLIRQQLEKGEIDAVPGMLYSPERDLIYDFTAAHIVNNYVAVVRKGDGHPPETLKDLKDKRILVQRGDIMHDFALQHKLTNTLITLGTHEEVLQALSNGEGDVALVSRLVSLYWLDKLGIDNLVVGKHSLTSPGYSIAVNQNQKALLAQLSEGLAILEEKGEYRKIYEKWMGVYLDNPRSFTSILQTILMILVPMLLLLLGMLLWSWSLRKKVAERTEKLRESEEKYRALTEYSTDTIMRFDRQHRHLFVNAATKSLTGIEAEVFLGKTHAELGFPKHLIEMWEPAMDKVFETGKPSRLEFLLDNGTWVDWRLFPELSESGEATAVITSARDITDLKNAEQALRQSEAHHRTLVETIPDLVWLKDITGVYLSCNHAFERFFGASEREIIGKTDYDFVDKELADFFRNNDRKALEADGPRNNEEWLTFADGGYHGLFETIKSPMRDADGKLIGVLGVARDITERKQSEAELQKRESLLQRVFELLPVGLWLADKDGKLLRGNPAGIRIWGAEPHVSPENYGIFKARRLPSGKEIQPDDWALAHTIRDGITVTNELIEIDAFDGVTRTILNSTAPVFNEDGNSVGAIVVNQDISDLKRAEAKQAYSHNLLQNLGRLVPGVIYQYRIYPDGRSCFPWASPGIKTIYEVSPEEVRDDASPVFGRLHPDDKDDVAKAIQESAERLSTFYSEFRVILPEQGLRWRWSQAHPERTDDGGTLWHGIISDITERKQAEEEQARLSQQLQQAQKMESVGRLAGGVAHDFNNLLTGITGNVALALMDLTPGDPLCDTLEEINQAVDSAASLTHQLLAFSRKQIIKPKVLDLNQLIETMRKMLVRLIGEDIDLQSLPGEDLGRIKADPGQVEQILVNLAVNARDAMPDGGQLKIETTNVHADAAYCDLHAQLEPGDYVLLSVSDTGLGMDDETGQRIFDPFFTTKAEGEGTGLGMATVYGIVKQHSGHIEMNSTLGEGTRFAIYFPLVEDQAEVIAPSRPHDNLPRGHETIFVVEDEPMVRNIAIRILKRQGYKVYFADSGGDTLAMLDKRDIKPDLLLTDIVMPNMNGKELADRLTPRFPDLKVIFTSGYTEDVIAHHGILDEGLNFIPKPYTPQVLAKKVRAVLDGN